MDADGITRKARARRCPSCRAAVVRGLDHDRCALTVVVDPTPLSPAGELEALLLRRFTFDLRRFAGQLNIDRRYPERIVASPAGTPPGDVVVAHDCNAPPISGTTTSNLDRSVHHLASQVDTCPF